MGRFLDIALEAVGLKDKAHADKVVKLDVAPPAPDATNHAAHTDEKPARLPEVVPPPVIPIDSKMDKAEARAADVATATADALPIYTATAKEINLWHAYGCNVFLQGLLREYDLDYLPPNVAAYNHFKIGLDTKRHMATFAIDATHYHAIDFNEYNSAPLDKTQARRVLEKISAIRLATRRFKDFCGFQVECFD